MEKLPDEIMVDILSRLSLKTLFQCTRVCKTWRSIILRDAYFANMHLTRSSQVDVPYLVYKPHTYTGEPPQLCLIDFNSNDCQDHTLNIRFELRFNFDAILSCNGLLCLCDCFNNPIYVCNPITGDHVTLPQQWAQCKDRRFIPGFGFDARSKKYKVIRLMYFKKQGVASDLVAEVYTLGSGAWRSIGSVGCQVISKRQSFYGRNFSGPVNIHGAIHWMIELNFNPIIREIVAWNVSDEKFCVVPCPKELVPNEDFSTMGLTTINKCLSVYYYNNGLGFLDIWIMKDYNVEESWIKEVRKDIPPENRWSMESSLSKSVTIFQQLYRRSSMDVHVKAIYSCDERRFREVQETPLRESQYIGCSAMDIASHFIFSSVTGCRGMDIATHVGSFISVGGGNSWPDDVGPNRVAASRVLSAKRKRR